MYSSTFRAAQVCAPFFFAQVCAPLCSGANQAPTKVHPPFGCFVFACFGCVCLCWEVLFGPWVCCRLFLAPHTLGGGRVLLGPDIPSTPRESGEMLRTCCELCFRRSVLAYSGSTVYESTGLIKHVPFKKRGQVLRRYGKRRHMHQGISTYISAGIPHRKCLQRKDKVNALI